MSTDDEAVRNALSLLRSGDLGLAAREIVWQAERPAPVGAEDARQAAS